MTDPPSPQIAPYRDGAEARLQRLRGLVEFLETAVRIPGTRIRFGADAVVGLVPGLGDIVGGVLSAMVITEALRTNVPGAVIQRMFWNLAVDLVVGAVPVAGDLFDVFWKAGVRNLALLERYRAEPAQVTAAAHRTMIWIAAAFGLLAAAAMAFGVLVTLLFVRWLASWG